MNSLRNKWIELQLYVQDFDICVLTESKLDSFIPTSAFNLSDYRCNRHDRNSNGGGLLTYIKNDLHIETLNNEQQKYRELGLEITIDLVRTFNTLPFKACSTIILGLYRPPNVKQEWFQIANDLILELIPKGNLIIMGDLNCNLLQFNNNNTNKLLNILELAQVNIIEVEPTRVTSDSSSCLDLIAIHRYYHCTTYRVGCLAISDHFPVEAEIELNYYTTTCKPTFRRNFKKIDYGAINSDIRRISIENANSDNPDEQLSYWSYEMENILDFHAPLKAYPAQSKKRLSLPPEIIAMINLRKKLVRKVKSSPSDKILFNELKLIQRRVKSNITRFLKVQGENTLSSCDRRESWKFIRNVTNTYNSHIPPLANIEDLNNYFADIVNCDSVESKPMRIASCSREDCFQIQEISVPTVLRYLHKLKDNTATGYDGLPSTFLKKTATSIAPNITKILNSSIINSQFPNAWKKANIAAIYKGRGSKKDSANYRPISILPCLSRIFEKEISSQLSSYCLSRQIIPNEQFGFRPLSSCETALLAAINNWVGDIDRPGFMIGVLLIDLSKAFDNVNHAMLISDLEQIGCSPSTLSFFTSYLTGRMQRVSSRDHATDWRHVTKGVPQGSSISPILFNIYMRNLPKSVSDPIYQFADDITNSTAADNIDEIKNKLAENFHSIKSFCKTRELNINTDKTKCILLKLPSRKIDEKDLELILDNHKIEFSKTVELLGFTIDQHLTFKQQIEKTVKKCRGILGVIKKAKAVLSTQLLKLCYTSLVRPHLEYCSLVFANSSNSNLMKLETLQKIASRIICGEPSDAHSDPLLLRLGLQKLGERRQLKVIKEVKKIISEDCHPMLLNMFNVRSDGLISNEVKCRTNFGKKRFSFYATEIFNRVYDIED